MSATQSSGRVLVAGIGNVFLGDDGFGVEVVRRLGEQPLPDHVEVGDFGVRSFDLAYALMEPWELVVLVDALPQGRPPGTVFVLEPDIEALEGPAVVEGHTMNPVEVFRLVHQMEGTPPRVLLVGCEPESLGGDEGRMGLSEPVAAAIDPALDAVRSLLVGVAAGA
ncbi:MAG: hydrogenase maturation protease [Candidatus Dormibacteraeota bacterium]|nr:hydrogenase maturation protease [Candidatus Dormibacteraeota bacterium]